MKGGWGREVKGFSVTEVTLNAAFGRAAESAAAEGPSRARRSEVFAPVESKSLDPARSTPPRLTSVAPNASGVFVNVAVTSCQVAEVKAMRSRSRSTTRRVATDCTRPAERRGSTFFQSTGETS